MLYFYLSIIETQEQKDKFTVLYESWRNLMFRAAKAELNGDALAEDAVQEAFLYVIKKLDTIEDPRSEKTKAFVIFITKCTARKLKREKYAEIPMEEIPDKDEGDAVEDTFFNDFSSQRIKELVQELPELYRTPLILQYAEGYSGRQIAALLGLKEATVRKRIERAKKKLATMLIQEGITPTHV